MKICFPLTAAAALAAALSTLKSNAELLVYDGIPIAGSGRYAVGDLIPNVSGMGTAQNPTHASIVGETGAWKASSGTGLIKVSSSTNLFYPAGINLSPLADSGVIDLTGNNASNPYRWQSRAISPAIAQKSVFATVLIAYDDLSGFPDGSFGGWGLSKTWLANDRFETDGLALGFHKDALSPTGVSAVMVMREAGANVHYVIQRGVAPGTHLFALRFQYSVAGGEIVSAALLADGAEPSLSGGGWAVTATNNLPQSIDWVAVGYSGNNNSKHIYIDEWRVGTEWRDVAGADPDASYVVNAGAENFTSDGARLKGAVTKSGDPATVVRVYFGTADGLDDPDAWGGFHDFTGEPADTDGQEYAFQAADLMPETTHYFRYAVSNELAGEIFAPWTDSFLTISAVMPGLEAGGASNIQKTSATVNGWMTNGYPVVAVAACVDTVDHGDNSLPSEWAQTVHAGDFTLEGAFSAAFSGLTACTDYIARFYGTNAAGGAWSAPIAFATLPPSLSALDQYVKEGDAGEITDVVIPISLDTPGGKPVTFNWQTSQAAEANCENAVPGRHYIHDEGIVVMPPGLTQTNITVRVIGNDRDEFPGRRFYVRAAAIANVAIAGSAAAIEVGTLDDDMGKRIFFDDFNDGNANGWTAAGPGWSVAGNRYRLAYGAENNRFSRAGQMDMKEYGFRVTHMIWEGGWKDKNISAYNRVGDGGGEGYKFVISNDEGYTGRNGRLLTNGVWAAGGADEALAGSRLGRNPIMRPLSMRVTRTPEGHNRVQCWAGYHKTIDYIDESGAFLEGGQIALGGADWSDFYWDDVEVFVSHGKATMLLVR